MDAGTPLEAKSSAVGAFAPDESARTMNQKNLLVVLGYIFGSWGIWV